MAAAVLLAVAYISMIFWDRPEFLISSDTLLPVDFVWDVQHNHGAWWDFQQARVSSFFPDLLVMGLSQVLIGSWRVAFAIWVFITICWLALAMGWIAKDLARTSFRTALLSLLPLLALLLSIAAFDFPGAASDGYIFPFRLIVLPFTHGGPFLLALTAAAVAAKPASDRAGGRPLVILAALTCGAAVSDLLCLTSLILPLTLAAVCRGLVNPATRQADVRAVVTTWGSGGLGWALSQTLMHQPAAFPSLVRMPGNAVSFVAGLGRHPDLIGVMLAFVVAVALDVAWRGARGWLSSFWSVFGATCALGSLALTMLVYEDIGAYRYAQPFWWWSFIFVTAALLRLLRRRPVVLRGTVTAIVAGVGVAFLAVGWHRPRLLGWKPALVLLCHKTVRRVVRWQHGQRGRMRLMVRAIAMRTDVMEFGT